MNTTNIDEIKTRPPMARSRLEATKNGNTTIVYNDSTHFLLRVAMALKADTVTITSLH